MLNEEKINQTTQPPHLFSFESSQTVNEPSSAILTGIETDGPASVGRYSIDVYEYFTDNLSQYFIQTV